MRVRVAGDELDCRGGQALGGQPRRHLVSEQAPVDLLADAGCGRVFLDDLMDPASGVRAVVARFEQVLVEWHGLPNTLLASGGNFRRRDRFPAAGRRATSLHLAAIAAQAVGESVRLIIQVPLAERLLTEIPALSC